MLTNRSTAPFLFAALAAAWVIFCYNPFLLWFQNDDFTHLFLSRNGVIFQTDAFRPLCDVHRIIEYNLWGKNPVGYHATNIVLHFACTVVFFYLAKKFVPGNYTTVQARIFALTAATLFLITPNHCESTFWILGDTAILGAIFPLVALLFFLKEKRSDVHTVISLAAYTLSLLTYESGWVIPVIAFVLQWQTGSFVMNVKRNQGYFATQMVIFFCYIYAKAHVNTHLVGNYEAGNFLHFNLAVLAKNFVGLCFMGFITNTGAPMFVFAGFLALFVVVCIIWVNGKRNFPFKLWLCFLIAVLPYLSLGIDTHGTEGGRFIYLPSIFVVLIITHAVQLVNNSRLQYLFVCFALILFGAKLYVNAINYRFAGNVVRQTVSQLADVPYGKTVIIDGLPASQHGAVILRSGVTDAINFYLPEKRINAQVHSWRDDLKPLHVPYKIVDMAGQSIDDTTIRYVYTDTAMLVYK